MWNLDALLVFGFVLVGIALVLVVWGIFSIPTTFRTAARSFRCPFLGKAVSVEFEHEMWSGKPLGVSRCSAFRQPDAIECDQLCIHLTDLPPVGTGVDAA